MPISVPGGDFHVVGAHPARCSQMGKEKCRGLLVLILLLASHIGIQTPKVAYILAAHPPTSAEGRAPSSLVPQRKAKSQSAG